MDNFCEAFRNLIIYIRAIFSILKIVKEFILDLMLEAIDIILKILGPTVDCSKFWVLYRRDHFAPF